MPKFCKNAECKNFNIIQHLIDDTNICQSCGSTLVEEDPTARKYCNSLTPHGTEEHCPFCTSTPVVDPVPKPDSDKQLLAEVHTQPLPTVYPSTNPFSEDLLIVAQTDLIPLDTENSINTTDKSSLIIPTSNQLQEINNTQQQAETVSLMENLSVDSTAITPTTNNDNISSFLLHTPTTQHYLTR